MKSWQIAKKLFKRKPKNSNKSREDKRKAQKFHAIGRYFKRFGKQLSEEEYLKLIEDIQSGRAEFIERQSVRVTIWKVKIHENEPIAVYDKDRKTIITFITQEMWNTPKYTSYSE